MLNKLNSFKNFNIIPIVLYSKRKDNIVLQLKIEKIIKETPDTFSYLLKDINSLIDDFLPGQYITLNIKQGDKLIKRSYSISSSNNYLPYIRITIKQNKNNPSYTQFCENLSIGDVLDVDYPSGEFCLDEKESENKNFLFVAGGSGITPIISMIYSALQKNDNSKIYLLYQNRDEQNIIFNEEIIKLKNDYEERFNFSIILSRPLNITCQFKGRIDDEYLTKFFAKNFKFMQKSEIYVCGPEGLIDTVFTTFPKLNFDKNKIHREIYKKFASIKN